MKLKTYTAPTLDEALEQVRNELGSEAVIVQTRKVRSTQWFSWFKRPQHEVVAALEPSVQQVSQVAENEQYKVTETVVEQPVRDLRYDKVLMEMRELKQMLYENAKAPKLPKLLGELDSDLKQRGVHAEARHSFLSEVQLQHGEKRVTASALIASVSKTIEALDFTTPPTTKILCFAGPTGVGKTTTIAKWATQEIVHNKRKVGLITTDTFRIGAIEQLRTYATILKAPFEIVTNPKEIHIALEKLKDCDRILIDTAGRNYQQEAYIEEIKQVSKQDQCDIQLVLSLTASYADCQMLLAKFKPIGISGVVLTKLDETSQPGHVLNLYYDAPCPISAVTTGQHVPQDMVFFGPEVMRHILLGEALVDGSSLSTS
ncbi:flagellar biosynthesis protein FlhF [Chryseomicrobium palamuruense]